MVYEEVLAAKAYSVLVPVAYQNQAQRLAILGGAIAAANDGEVLALHVVRLPVQLSLNQARLFVDQGKQLMAAVTREADNFQVPVNTMIRAARHRGAAIFDTARARNTNLIILGWPGYSGTETAAFGGVIDLLANNPPCDIAVVRFRTREAPQNILIPTAAGGPNAPLAIELAIAQAQQYERNHPGQWPVITLLNVVTKDAPAEVDEAAAEQLRGLKTGFDYPLEIQIVRANDIVAGILQGG